MQGVTRWPAVVVVAIVAALVAGGGVASAQQVTEPSECGATVVETVFIGRVTGIVDDRVTFAVSEVRSGSVDGETITVRYPTRYNARELRTGDDYLVPLVDAATGAAATEEPQSFVDTAELDSCASTGTRNADGSPIDTGAFANVGPTLASYAAWTAAAVAVLLVVLVVLGRFLDRRSRYRRPVRL